MDEDSSSGFGLSDFLSSGLSLYNTYQQGKNTTDQAKLQQQLAATQAAQAAQNQNQLRQILVWGGAALVAIFALVIFVKAFKK